MTHLLEVYKSDNLKNPLLYLYTYNLEKHDDFNKVVNVNSDFYRRMKATKEECHFMKLTVKCQWPERVYFHATFPKEAYVTDVTISGGSFSFELYYLFDADVARVLDWLYTVVFKNVPEIETSYRQMCVDLERRLESRLHIIIPAITDVASDKKDEPK